VVEKGIHWKDDPEMVIALSDALVKLEEIDATKAAIVDMKFFADLSVEAMAEALGISERSVNRHWAVARVWLSKELKGRR
jgi:DNA-directed RNA polymerase specialized sigma24 family protein